MALMETLCDDCAGPSLNAQWTSQGDTITFGGGIYTLPTTTNYCNMNAQVTRDETASYFFAKVGITSGANRETVLWVMQNGTTANDGLLFRESNGTLTAGYRIGGADTTLATLTYSTTNHAWMRMREAGGTCFWDTSADAVTWTNQASHATPLTITALFGGMYTGRFGAGTNSSSTIADINIVPHAPQSPAGNRAAVQRASTW